MVKIEKISEGFIEVKNSKFYSFLMPYEEFEIQMKQLRLQHPKAVHWVSAYRTVNEYDQILEHSSDDGEPRGTSGKPTLSVLQGHDLINCAIITVRYFGGTKLGPGGLVRAYADAANAACDTAEFFPYEKLIKQNVSCPYSTISILEYECAQNNVKITSKTFDENGALLVLEGTMSNLDNLYDTVGRQIKKEN